MKQQKKKRNKKYTPAPQNKNVVKFGDATAEQQVQYLWGDKKPYCTVCDTDCTLASEHEVQQYKTFVDPTYNLKFIWVPKCECYNTVENWMSEQPR